MSSPEENPPQHHEACLERAPTRPLHDCAYYLITFTHGLFEKITDLPFPIGTIIKCVEGVVDPWTHPLVEALECHCLNILAAIDDKACLERTPTRPLHDSASYLISFTHALSEKITHLPFPIGTIIKCVEGVVDPWTHPLVEAMECHGLNILAAIDDKVYTTGTFVEGCIFCAAAKLKVVSTLLYKRGLIGTSADLWVKYEAMVREDVQKAIHLANKFPLVNLITPLFCAIFAPPARVISDWLVKHGERREEGMEVTYDSFVVQKQQVEHECMNIELEAPSYMDVVHLGGKDVDVDDVGVDVDVGVGVGVKAEKTAEESIEEPVGLIEEEGDYLPDVLKMIDSSWLLGTAATSSLPKKTWSPPTISSSSPSSSVSKLIRRIFNG